MKVKRCKVKTCRKEFIPARSFVDFCSIDCAIILANDRLEKAETARLKKQRKEHRERLRESKPLSYWLNRTQTAVNKLRRKMDEGKPCYTCGTYETVQREAGHYRSRGACSSARFDIERNIRTQCHHCNVHLSGNLGVFRANLVQEIGEDEVLKLEAMPKSYRWTREELKSIEDNAKERINL